MGSPFVWWKTGKLSFLPVNRTDLVHDEVQNRLFPQIFRYDLQCLMELAPVMYPAPCDLQISKIWCSSTSTFQAQSGNIWIWHLEAVFILFADLFFSFWLLLLDSTICSIISCILSLRVCVCFVSSSIWSWRQRNRRKYICRKSISVFDTHHWNFWHSCCSFFAF